MDIQELIDKVRKDNVLVEKKKEELERLHSLCGVTGISFEEKTSATPNPKRIELSYLNYIEFKEELEKFIDETIKDRKKLMNIIDTLNDKKEIKLMYMYCFENRSLTYIAKKMNYTKQRIYQLYNHITDTLSQRLE